MNYSTRDPQPVSRDPVPRNTGISREFVLKSILHILDTVPVVKGWGSWQISYKAGEFKTIEEKKTTVTEEK